MLATTTVTMAAATAAATTTTTTATMTSAPLISSPQASPGTFRFLNKSRCCLVLVCFPTFRFPQNLSNPSFSGSIHFLLLLVVYILFLSYSFPFSLFYLYFSLFYIFILSLLLIILAKNLIKIDNLTLKLITHLIALWYWLNLGLSLVYRKLSGYNNWHDRCQRGYRFKKL